MLIISTVYLIFVLGINIFISYETSIFPILISSLPLVKPKRLSQKEKAAFTLPDDLKEILVGLMLGDLYARLRYNKTSLTFLQSIIHQDYIYYLYQIFSKYCPSEPRLSNNLPDSRTGKIYNNISFTTYTLSCFNDLYNLFYLSKFKVIPSNIAEILTPVSLAYLISDDGFWNKIGRFITLCTDSFTLIEVELLIDALNKNFNLKCYKCKYKNNYRIIIPSYSISTLQNLIAIHMPPMMKYKINL